MFDNTVVLYLYSNTSSLGEHEIINNNNNLTYAKPLNSSVVHEFTWIHFYFSLHSQTQRVKLRESIRMSK